MNRLRLSAPPRSIRWTPAVVLLACCTLASALSGPGTQKPKSSEKVPTTQEKQIFSMVSELLKFSSEETGLPLQSQVREHLISRSEVESYLKQKMAEDQDAQRMQSSEIVLKKFGFLDKDFDLKPFLLSLLTEQIAAYYDPKTKSINLLDWVDPEEQKPILAHELTHALQDQHSDLDKWLQQTPSSVSASASEDSDHINRDEMDSAREAVTEGQATAVMIDAILRPSGQSLIDTPELGEAVRTQMGNQEDSPVMAQAPLLLSESMLFPYREGMVFTQDLWMEKGKETAFAGALDHPPASTWEIYNPLYYVQHRQAPVPLLPNIHPLVDSLYKPYDIGQVGELDLHILARQLGDEEADQALTPAWKGGLYWAGQLKTAKTATDLASTNSIAYFYLSNWSSPAAAALFADLWGSTLGHKYTTVKPQDAAQSDLVQPGENLQLFSTEEGSVMIVQRGTLVFVSESFAQPLARKLATLLLDAQGGGALQIAQGTMPTEGSVRESLSGAMVRFFSNCGVLKTAAEAAIRAAK